MSRLPDELALLLASVRSAGAITGAGISAESGIPTYRGKGGIYDDPDEGDATIEALSGSTFRRDPERTLRAIFAIAERAAKARPNPAHEALAAIERKLERFVLLTQNVDGLHRLAGSRNVIDIHGDTLDARCLACDWVVHLGGPEEVLALPPCPSCASRLRPDVVLFEEMLPEAKFARLHRELVQSSPDLLVVAGTSALFPYIVEPVRIATARGKTTVEVNLEETEVSRLVRFALRGKASEILPEMARALGA